MTQKQAQAFGVLKWVGTIILTGVVAWTTMKMTVAQNSMSISTHTIKLEKYDARIRAVEDCTVEQRVQNQWMKETLTRIENKMDK